jgi:hypothetical protein
MISMQVGDEDMIDLHWAQFDPCHLTLGSLTTVKEHNFPKGLQG